METVHRGGDGDGVGRGAELKVRRRRAQRFSRTGGDGGSGSDSGDCCGRQLESGTRNEPMGQGREILTAKQGTTTRHGRDHGVNGATK